ncbi:MAG TPA: metallophosphoesterase [Gemmatimonadales bacterium]|nr:metallophosphoesterase [Gemmatimonadales bacterium]
MPSRHCFPAAFLIVVCVAVAGCGDGRSLSGPGAVGPGPATLALRLTSVTLGVGERLADAARPLGPGGAPVAPASLTWSSSAPTVAAVSAAGEITAVAPGLATVRVSAGEATDSMAVTVVNGPTASLLAAGDIATCTGMGDDSTAALVEGLDGTVLTLGDNVYPDGSPQAYAQCYAPTWGRFKSRTYPAPGNHDYLTREAAGYFGYFGARAGPPGRGYYSFDLNGWHLVALNGEIDIGAGSPQLAWLAQDLAAHPAACTLAFWHEPRFSSGVEHGDNPGRTAVWQVLHDAGAELVLNGHDHDYERFAPQTPTGAPDEARGIREFVVGTGGAHAYGLGTRRPNSEASHSGTFGVLRLTLYAGGYAWEFVPADPSGFRDRGSGACH